MLQQPEHGGLFQFTKPFRNEDNEEQTYNIADKVISGDQEHIQTLEFNPGKTTYFLASCFDLKYVSWDYTYVLFWIHIHIDDSKKTYKWTCLTNTLMNSFHV